jgi:hypothetical protein
MFRSTVSIFSAKRQAKDKKQAELDLPFDPENEGSTFLRKVGKYLSDYTASPPIRQYSS